MPTVPGSWWGQAGHSAVVLLPAAFFEELFIRGYAFAVLRRAGGWRLALIVTSVVFGILHAWNPGADAESILAVIVAGFFLGGILLATRSLYAAGAAHFAWNWVMSGALHIAVSGIPSADPDYRVVETGPDWLTGGPCGPEGGLAAVAVMMGEPMGDSAAQIPGIGWESLTNGERHRPRFCAIRISGNDDRCLAGRTRQGQIDDREER